MNAEWLSDARKIPDEVMNCLRRIAVHAVVDGHHSPDLVADVLNISRSAVYRWISQYREGGEEALDTKKAPGAMPVITPQIERWLRRTILWSTPERLGYDTRLWTLAILVEVLRRRFGIVVYPSTVANHLHKMGLSCQVPQYRSDACDPAEAERFVTQTWPKIQHLADKLGADIAFGDEAGIGIMTRSGRTWGEVNSPPVVSASDKRGGYNVLSAITLKGALYTLITSRRINSKGFIAFLEKVMHEHPRPIIFVLDHASFHKSKEVRDFVRAHRDRMRIFFLPKHAPHLNPDEQVWNEIKHRKLGRQPIKDKRDLIHRIFEELNALRRHPERILSFFSLKNTKYILDTNSAPSAVSSS